MQLELAEKVDFDNFSLVILDMKPGVSIKSWLAGLK
jgi:hypothetical protein